MQISEKYGFIKYAELILENDVIKPIECENKRNVVYAIVINDILVYIGKTKNLKKRIGYYRTALNRIEQTSDSVKSHSIYEALKSGHKVEFYARQCFDLSMTNELGTMSISTMDLEEPMFIKLFTPAWNVQHKGKKNATI